MAGARRTCEGCTKRLKASASARARYCSPACRQRQYRQRQGGSVYTLYGDGVPMDTECAHCTQWFTWHMVRAGQSRQYCSDACKQAAYRVRAQEERERRERYEEAWRQRRAREEWTRQERARQGSGREEQPGGGGRAYGRHSSMTLQEARAVLFRLAGGLVDDGTQALKSVYRKAARRVHPDLGGREAEFKLLERAAALLRTEGLLA